MLLPLKFEREDDPGEVFRPRLPGDVPRRLGGEERLVGDLERVWSRGSKRVLGKDCGVGGRLVLPVGVERQRTSGVGGALV